MGVILGKKVLIYSGATGTTPVVAAAKNCSINIKYDMIEKASSTQSTAKEFITGRYEWELTVDHLVVSGSEYQGIRLAGQRVLISVVINNVRKKGYVIVPQAGISAPVNGLATGSVTFKGDGEFDINT
jgi:hypothetical protein